MVRDREAFIHFKEGTLISSKLPLEGQMAIVSCFRNASIIQETFLDYQSSISYLRKALIMGRRLASTSDQSFLEMMEDSINLEERSAILRRSNLDDLLF